MDLRSIKDIKQNKSGQNAMIGIMIAVVIFIAAVIMITPIKDMTEYARDADHLDCSNASISTGTRLTCIVTDIYLFYFFGIAVSAGLAYIFARKLAGDSFG